MDVLAIMALLLLHPVLYHLDNSRGFFPPDAVGYMVFAENFLSKGLLYLERGIAGTGNILPPLYPFLMLIGNFFVDDFIITSELVSSVAIISSSIVFYFIIRKFGSSYFAFLGALGIQLNYQINLWAITPLTEASFILILACSLLLMIHVLNSERAGSSVALGLLLALVFLTRQVGIILVPFFLLVIFFASPHRFLMKSLGLVVGMALLLAPYSVILHIQGSQIEAEFSAFEQSWSTRERISIDDVDQDVQEYLRRLHDTQSENYGGVYVKRRLLRQLLPDSSAMLQDVEMEPARAASNGVVARLVKVWSSLDQIGDRLVKNAQYIYESVGPFVCVVFMVMLITPIWIRMNREILLPRYLIGGFVLYYLLAISLLTGLIDRYVLILAPFILLHIFVEVIWLLRLGRKKVREIPVAHMIFAIILAACVYSQPMNYSDIPLHAKGSLEQIGESNFRKFVDAGEPVLSIAAFHAYVSGGTWWVMPNDSLEKIAKYAAQEDVRWLLVVHKPQKEVSAYKFAKSWYLDKSLLRQYRHLVELRAVSRDGQSFLFQFKRE